MKDLSGFVAPYYDQNSIWKAADEFYQKYGENAIPVDIEGIVEFDLKLEILPKQNLASNCDSDAFLSSDCKTIYVDYAHYFNSKYHNRFRFSLAHEIGHLILHKEMIPELKSENPEDWKNIILTIPQREYTYLELQAYEFAGRLLVPRNNLIEELKNEKENIKIFYNPSALIFDDDVVIEYVSIPISKIFKVSHEVISRRIKKENLWEMIKSELIVKN